MSSSRPRRKVKPSTARGSISCITDRSEFVLRCMLFIIVMVHIKNTCTDDTLFFCKARTRDSNLDEATDEATRNSLTSEGAEPKRKKRKRSKNTPAKKKKKITKKNLKSSVQVKKSLVAVKRKAPVKNPL